MALRTKIKHHPHPTRMGWHWSIWDNQNLIAAGTAKTHPAAKGEATKAKEDFAAGKYQSQWEFERDYHARNGKGGSI